MKKSSPDPKSAAVIYIGTSGFDKSEKNYISYAESLSSAALYGICSTSMAFLNKTVISSFDFDYPLFIMFCQMSMCIMWLEFLRISGAISIPKFSLKLGKTFMWPSLFYAIHSITALHALGGMSIPMYAAVKRCAPIVTLILSVIILQKRCPSLKLILSVIFISVGCVLAGFGDLKFDLRAYRYGAISVLVQGLYLTLAQKSLQKMSAVEVLYISSYNTVLIFAGLSLYLESKEVTDLSRFSDIAFVFCFILQTSVGVLLNYSLFLCTAKNSALTTSLVGVLKSILQTVIGFFTFGGIEFNMLNIFGISLNMFGGIMYTYLKYQERKRAFDSVQSVSVS